MNIIAALKIAFPGIRINTLPVYDCLVVTVAGEQKITLWDLKDGQGNAIASPVDANGSPNATLVASDATAQLVQAKTAKATALKAALGLAMQAGVAVVIPTANVGITLAADPADQAKLTGLTTLLREMETAAGNPAGYDQAQTQVIDAAGVVHALSIADLRTTLISYGQVVLSLTAANAGKLAAVAAATTVAAVNAIS